MSRARVVEARLGPRIARFILIVLTLEILGCLATYAYVRSERFVYFWDFANYQTMSATKAREFAVSPLNALRHAKRSIAYDYNELFTLPLIPFLLPSADLQVPRIERSSFIVSLAAVYMIPFVLVTAAVATRVIPDQGRLVFLATVVVAFLTPAVWVPTLRGFPDIGGVILIALAILAYLHDPRMARLWQPVAIGALLAAAMLFRRHLIYSGIALVMSITLHTAYLAIKCPEKPGFRPLLAVLLGRGVRVALIGLVVLATLAVIGRPFLRNLLTINYSALYSSYKFPFSYTVAGYVSVYGLFALLVAALGYAIGISSRFLDRPAGSFLCLFGIVSLVNFATLAGQVSEHLTVHFTLPVVIGLSSFVSLAWARLGGLRRALVLGFVGAGLAVGTVLGLTHSQGLRPPIPDLFPSENSPLVRDDLLELRRLIDYLRARVTPKDMVYVVGSSFTFNENIIYQAEHQWFGPGEARIRILQVPITDSGDFYPIEQLFEADYVLVANPVQLHLPTREQDVVRIVHDLFTQDRLLAKDFTRLPARFRLENDVSVDVHHRSRSTTLEEALRTLVWMQEEVTPRPGRQGDWIGLDPDPDSRLTWNPAGGWNFQWDPTGDNGATFLVYIGALPAKFVVTGRLEVPTGKSVSMLRISTVGPRGDLLQSVDIVPAATERNDFAVPFDRQHATALAIELRIDGVAESISSQRSMVTQLSVKPAE